MDKRVGIPRAMLFYQYYPLWRTFFESLGAQVIVSQHTTKNLLNAGIRHAVDEACLPVKVYYGHVLDLLDKVDYIFCPRLVSVEPKTYICPKFLGLPDMIKNNIPGLPEFINVTVNLHDSPKNLWRAIYQTGRLFTVNPWRIYQAYQQAKIAQENYEQQLLAGKLPSEVFWGKGSKPNVGGIGIAVIGHPYNIYDEHISMNLIEKLLRLGVKVYTPEAVAPEVITEQAAKLPKKLFWNMGKHLIGASFHYLDQPEIKGIINVTAFGCGPDSFTSEFIERTARRKGKAYLNLTIDEHTGEAGVVTRLEAFLDMIHWREKSSESNLSAHG